MNEAVKYTPNSPQSLNHSEENRIKFQGQTIDAFVAREEEDTMCNNTQN